jgi:hypothetical protein
MPADNESREHCQSTCNAFRFRKRVSTNSPQNQLRRNPRSPTGEDELKRLARFQIDHALVDDSRHVKEPRGQFHVIPLAIRDPLCPSCMRRTEPHNRLSKRPFQPNHQGIDPDTTRGIRRRKQSIGPGGKGPAPCLVA